VHTGFRHLTLRGRSFLIIGCIAVGTGVLIGQRDVLRLGILLIGLVIVSVGVVTRTRHRVTARRVTTDRRTSAGVDVVIRLRIENPSRFPTGVLLADDQIPYALGSPPRFILDRIPPHRSVEVSYRIRPELRGQFDIGPVRLRVGDPFGLCELRLPFTEVDPLLVTPAVEPLPVVPLTGKWAGAGTSVSRTRTHSPSGNDDFTTRDYRQGDELRRVHWPATAKRGSLVVRCEEQPWHTQATVYLDTRASAHCGSGPSSSFEWAVAAAASICAHLDHRGYAVNVLTDGGFRFPPSPSGHQSTDALFTEFANVQPSATPSLHRMGALPGHGGAPGMIIAVLGALEVDDVNALRSVQPRRASSFALTINRESWHDATPRTLTAAPSMTTSIALRRAGWRVIEIRSDDRLADVWSQLLHSIDSSSRRNSRQTTSEAHR
jgi:uncharacterized protein (DUF58 family)